MAVFVTFLTLLRATGLLSEPPQQQQQQLQQQGIAEYTETGAAAASLFQWGLHHYLVSAYVLAVAIGCGRAVRRPRETRQIAVARLRRSLAKFNLTCDHNGSLIVPANFTGAIQR